MQSELKQARPMQLLRQRPVLTPAPLKDSASVNFNNNVCESMEKDVKESKVSVTPPLSLKHPLEHTWTLWSVRTVL